MTLTFNDKQMKFRRRELRKNQTDAEKFLWSRLRNKQIYGLKFFRQYSIGSYILDFYCPAKRLAIELDGGQHAEENQAKYDDERSQRLARQNIRMLRFWNDDVLKNIEGVLQNIVEMASARNSPNPS